MNNFGLYSCILFLCLLMPIANSQYWNLGLLPSDWYKPDCEKEPQEDTKPFLMVCTFSFEEYCVFNSSVPFMHWYKCDKKHDITSFTPMTCTADYYEVCNMTYRDPGDIIYRPLLHPEEKVRLYPEIFEEIRYLNISYVEAFVNVLRETFTDAFYSQQYNYKEIDEEEVNVE